MREPKDVSLHLWNVWEVGPRILSNIRCLMSSMWQPLMVNVKMEMHETKTHMGTRRDNGPFNLATDKIQYLRAR